MVGDLVSERLLNRPVTVDSDVSPVSVEQNQDHVPESTATDRFGLVAGEEVPQDVPVRKNSLYQVGLSCAREILGDSSNKWPHIEEFEGSETTNTNPTVDSMLSRFGVYQSTLPKSTREWLSKMESQKKLLMISDVVQKLQNEGGMEALDAIMMIDSIANQYPNYSEWVITSLPCAAKRLSQREMTSGEIRNYLISNWANMPIDLLEGQDVELSQLNNIEFISQNVNHAGRKEYIETVSWLRMQGVSDKDIQSIIEKWNIQDIHAFAKSLNAVGVDGVSPGEIVELFDMGRERDYEIWDFDTLSRNLPSNVSVAAIKSRLGLKGYMEFCAFCKKAENRGMLERRSALDLFHLCEGVKKRFNIQKWSYYNPIIFEHVLNPDPHKPKNLVIMARLDRSGAFYNDDLCMMTAIEQGLQLEIVETGNKYEIFGRARHLPRGSISRMDIFGHGSKSGIRLGKIYKDGRGEISTDDYKILWRSIGDRFVANARVGLHSCSTGEGGLDADNMVRFFADCLSPDDIPELVIEAPDRETQSDAEVGSDYRIHPRFDKASTIIYRR